MYKFIPIICLTILVAACSGSRGPQGEVVAFLDCATASNDIRALKHEKARVLEQIESGVTAVVPAYAVRSIFKIEKSQVGADDYIKKIDEKIAQIKRDCGLY